MPNDKYAQQAIQENIFAEDKESVDIEILKEKNIDTINSSIYLCGIKLTGSIETPTQPLFFGVLDEDKEFKANTPVYYFAPKDEKFDLGTLSIYLNHFTLILHNYSLIEQNLNIKLELTHKKHIKALEQAKLHLQEIVKQDIKAKQSKAYLYAVIEDDIIICPHGGRVILQSNNGKSFKSNGVPLILESDYLNSKIQGCTHSIAGVSYPCTKVVSVKKACSKKRMNDEFVILQDLVSHSTTDKGFALRCVFKPNKFIIDHSFIPQDDMGEEKKLTSASDQARLRLYYKEHNFQRDNLLIKRLHLNDKELYTNTFFKNLEFDIDKDTKEMNDKELLESLRSGFKQSMLFKQLELRLGIHCINFIFLIPQSLPKIYKQTYKNLEYRDYGIGEFKQIHSYTKDYNKEREIYHIRVFTTPYKAKKIRFEFATGLDDYLKNEKVCGFKILTEYIWGTNRR